MLYVSSNAFAVRGLKAILDAAAGSGLRNIELSAGIEFEPERDLPELRAARRNGFNFLVHNYFPPPEKDFVLNLGSVSPGWARRSLELCKRAVELCRELEAPMYTVHSGFSFAEADAVLGGDLRNVRPTDREEALEVFCASLSGLCDFAAANKVKIAFENNVMADFNLIDGENRLLLGVTAAEMTDVLTRCGKRNLGVLLDLAHANVSSGVLGFPLEEFMSELLPHAFLLHVSGNDGRTDRHAAISGSEPYLKYLRAGKNIPVVLESSKLSPDELRNCAKIISDLRS